jgi:hypothetical protein
LQLAKDLVDLQEQFALLDLFDDEDFDDEADPAGRKLAQTSSSVGLDSVYIAMVINKCMNIKNVRKSIKSRKLTLARKFINFNFPKLAECLYRTIREPTPLPLQWVLKMKCSGITSQVICPF